MASVMTRDNFAELLTPVHKKIFFDSYNEVPMVYKKIFKVEKMNAKSQTYPHLGAFGLWQENTEGSEFNLDDFAQGQVASFEARRFDKSYDLTWELCQDDQYNVFKGIGKGGSAKGLGRSLRATEETDTANVILGGFTNVGYDGKALFAADHPLINSTRKISNLITGALTDENLKAALRLMRKQTDEAGVPIAARATQLVVCPDLEFTAEVIVRSILQSGTNNNDVNVIPNLEIVVWDYLDDPTGQVKPWFVQDKTLDNLLFLRREEPIFGSKQLERKMDYNMYGYTRFDTGYCDWRGLVGSKGTAEPAPEPTPDPEPETLGELTATIAAGSSATATKVTAVTGQGTGTLKYLVDTTITAPELNDVATGYSALTLNTDITCADGDKIIVVEVDGDNKIKAASSVEDVVVGE
jgi:phage major head subunit gpT-like protein